MMTSTDSTSDSWVEVHFLSPDAQDDDAMQQQHQPALLQSSSQQRAMERLLREAQRSGASSISQSGNASPVYGDCRSPPALADDATTCVNTSSKATAELMQNNTDWLWDWSGPAAGSGRSKRGYRCSSACSKSAGPSSLGSLSLRKSGLMRRQPQGPASAEPGATSGVTSAYSDWQNWAYWCWLSIGNYYPQPVVSAVTHAVCFIVGAASVFVVMRSCNKQRTVLGH